MKKHLTFFFFLISIFLYAQVKVKDTTTRRSVILTEKIKNTVTFKSQNPPLMQVLGAPAANYSHFWEFGDGTYSKEKEPAKIYKKQGLYKVNLSVTNNYDNGKPPATRPKTVVITENSDALLNQIATVEKQDGLQLFASREPVPEQEIIVVATYRNELNYVTNGKLYLFYNDTEFKNKNFELLEVRTHFGERETFDNSIVYAENKNETNRFLAHDASEIPFFFKSYDVNDENLDETLLESKKEFRDAKVFEFDLMNPNETRNVFFTFKTTPEMLKDTSATVRMRGVYVSDRNYKTHKKRTLEMEIVTSHDPNKMSSNGAFMNYRLVRFKTVNFKTRFQNNGEGPAKMIRLETDIPEMFDKKTFKIVDSYPKCPICEKGEIAKISCLDTIIKKDQIYFTFKNIYLPGSEQKNVKEKDSTKGFVKYSMKFNKDFHKIKTKSRTAIYFDKNEPVITNYAVTRFLPGISIGAKAGYNYFPQLVNSQSYFVSATISPFKSYRWYWQVELQNSLHTYASKTETSDRFIQNPAVGNLSLERTTNTIEYRNYSVEIPILMRYNINNYIGVGAGIQANINGSQKEIAIKKTVIYEGVSDTNFIFSTKEDKIESLKTFQNFQGGILLDATFGFARIGPSLGLRYVLNSQKNFNYFQAYGIWKF